MAAQTLIGKKPVRRALISVYDKSGLIPLAQGLHEAGVTIVSTGSPRKPLPAKAFLSPPVEFVTGFPEILDGRVKTLHHMSTPDCSPTPVTPSTSPRWRSSDRAPSTSSW